MEKYYTVDEVAEMTGLTSRTIRTYISQGRLTGMRLGKQWRFTEADIARLYSSLPRIKNRSNKNTHAAVSDAVNGFLSEKHGSFYVCVVADCADMSESDISALETGLREKRAAIQGVLREGDIIVFSASPEDAAVLLNSVQSDHH